MKSVAVILLVSAFVATAASALSLRELQRLPAARYEEKRDELGQYALRYVTAEGIVVEESGALVPNDAGDGYVLVKNGAFSFVVDGTPYRVVWVADRLGFRAGGDHLPVQNL